MPQYNNFGVLLPLPAAFDSHFAKMATNRFTLVGYEAKKNVKRQTRLVRVARLNFCCLMPEMSCCDPTPCLQRLLVQAGADW